MAIVLIPKIPSADRPEQFRPISSNIDKIAAKILVGRLRGLLSQLISPEQGAFVPGRSISHQCLIAQEAVNKLRVSTTKEGFLAVKVDIEQTYDRMSWHTLRQVLSLLGFPSCYAEWLLQCVQAPKYTLVINGRRSDWIMGERGFRQECSLSPYLFTLCSELLSATIHEQGTTMGFPISIGGPHLSHLLYADDILILLRETDDAVRSCSRVLADYCSWTRKCINMPKSMLMTSKAMSCWKGDWVAHLLGFRRVVELDYLGVWLAMRKLNKFDFANTLMQWQIKIWQWGNRHLSLAGRATLVRYSFLAGLPYWLTHSEITRAVVDTVERVARAFLWQKGPSC
ncbi:hypothetical protein KSP39_PZI004817 [Platanthera zijinensis]|uniref:Reverse transcriptase domain-containing protein n=1 Tax=Platanthera zijinensis TaxID=2320716 RepID=A0AAP0BU88_9ASPA